ncbi:lysogenization protein HflD [Salinisphaera sp. RV14]|uniref:lysogenization protein HflD n=1 Tax=unclassified Salinisphaera TaxID=2649847 RepID=UPI003F84E6A9
MSQHNATLENQVLALAGVAQFTLYAHEMATEGRDLPARFERATQAIFCTDPDSAIDVYGDRAGVADGIRYLRVQLSGQRPDAKGAAVARYIGQILKLSGKVLDDEQALGRIRGAIDRARLAELDAVADILDAAYRETISPLKPQIMLHGEPMYLKNEYIQRRIRTQLLAAIRCGVMWRQCGGGFISLFFRRKALLAALE